MSDDELLLDRFWAFIAANRESLIRFAGKFGDDYQDLLADAIANAVTKLDASKRDEDWRAWLFSLIRWRAKDKHRTRARHERKADDVADSYTDQAMLSPAEFAVLSSDANNMRQAMSRMKPNERRVLELRYFDRLDDFMSIAAAMNVSPCDARQLHVRAKQSLRKLLRHPGN